MTITSRPEENRSPPLADVAITVAVVVMVVALLTAGGAPATAAAGLTGASTPVSWTVPALRLLADLATIATIGAVLTAVWLLPATNDPVNAPDGVSRRGQRLGRRRLRACQDAAVAAGVWATASIGELVVTAAVVLGIPLSQLPERAADAAAVPQVRALAVATAATALLAVLLSSCRTVGVVRIAALIAAAAVICPLLTGHSSAERTTTWASIATASLAVHVLAASAWIGGLGALLRYARHDDPVPAVLRYSRLALVSAGLTGFAGLLTAEIHIGRLGGWHLLTGWFDGGYGALAIAKVVAFALLVGIGGRHRRTTLRLLAAGNSRSFWRLAAGELVLMAATIGIAVALSRTP